MNRRKRLESAARLVGNAAAHLVLYRDQTGVREALEYVGQAAARIEVKSWNMDELERFRILANRHARKEIRLRTGVDRGARYEAAIAEAAHAIEDFIVERMG